VRIAVVTLFPEMFVALTDYGITGRAIGNAMMSVAFFNPRDYASDRHQSVDDRPYGGGPGMVMTIEPLRRAIVDARAWALPATVVYLTPQGRLLDHAGVDSLATLSGMVLVAGRYEGIDERLVELEVDQEWSIGDYVLSGGELPAMVLMDAVARQLPGVLGHRQSARQDSFVDGLLDCPHYTRPEVYESRRVPEVLLSGNHEAIRRWRLKHSLGRTRQRRPEMLAKLELSEEQRRLLSEYQAEAGQ